MTNNLKRIRTIHRWFKILATMRQGAMVSVEDLAERFGVTKRTIYRDLAELQELKIPLVSNQGYWYLIKGYPVPAIEFSLDEVAVLAGALGWACRNPALGGAAAISAMEKLKDAVPDRSFRTLMDELEASVVVDPSPARPTAGELEVEEVVRRAVRESHKLEVVYGSFYSGEATRRVIRPYGLAYRGVGLYVIGWCELRQAQRTFRLSRIRSARWLKDRFQVPVDFDLNAHLMTVWGIEDGADMHVILRFSPKVAQLARETQWHPTQEVEEQPDGGVLLHMVTRGRGELARWIAQYGGEVTVLEPPELARAVREIGDGIVRAYAEKVEKAHG
ncbi:MAG: YafY family protein [Bacillota bacterium]